MMPPDFGDSSKSIPLELRGLGSASICRIIGDADIGLFPGSVVLAGSGNDRPRRGL